MRATEDRTQLFREVLFPTDFSPASVEVLDVAASWARRFDARLHLLHVVLPVEPQPDLAFKASVASPSGEEMTVALEASAERRLTELAAKLDDPPARVEAHTRRGESEADSILAFAAERDIDLVVTASHGRRGFRRWMLGSVAEEVVRRSTCPVLVERHAADGVAPEAIERVLVPVDFSAPARESYRRGLRMAARLHTVVDLLTVVQKPMIPSSYGAAAMAEAGQVTAMLEAHARQELERMGQVADREVGVETFLRQGDPATEIVAHARERGCRLVLMATQGLSGVQRLLLGSVTERVLRRAECPVLVLPAESAAENERSTTTAPETSAVGA